MQTQTQAPCSETEHGTAMTAKEILYKETKIPEGAKVCVPQVDYNNGYYLSSVVYEDSACKTKVLKPDGNGFYYIDNISFVRYWTQAETAMELLQSRIIDYFGGNFQAEVVDPYTQKEPLTDVLHTGCIRYAYRDPSNHTIKTQKLELGGNITDVSSSYIAEDFYTGIVPVSSSNADNTTGESDATETMIYPDVTESDFDSDGNRKIDIKPYAAFSFMVEMIRKLHRAISLFGSPAGSSEIIICQIVNIQHHELSINIC